MNLIQLIVNKIVKLNKGKSNNPLQDKIDEELLKQNLKTKKGKKNGNKNNKNK